MNVPTGQDVGGGYRRARGPGATSYIFINMLIFIVGDARTAIAWPGAVQV